VALPSRIVKNSQLTNHLKNKSRASGGSGIAVQKAGIKESLLE
jgi:hypothetical protein